MISVYLQYFPSIRPLFAVPRTTEKYFDTRKQLILSFSVLFLYFHNTWHCYLYFAETVVATLFQQFSLFLKELTSSTIQAIYLYIFPIPWHHFYIKMYITNYNPVVEKESNCRKNNGIHGKMQTRLRFLPKFNKKMVTSPLCFFSITDKLFSVASVCSTSYQFL